MIGQQKNSIQFMARGEAAADAALLVLLLFTLLTAGGRGVIGGGFGNSSDAVRLIKLSRMRSFRREKGDAPPAATLRFASALLLTYSTN